MTHKQWIKLTLEKRRIRVAEFHGEKCICVKPALGIGCMLHDKHAYRRYLSDLNAMHEAVMWAFDNVPHFHCDYATHLMIVLIGFTDVVRGERPDYFDFVNATAAERAEAFCLTMDTI